MQLKCFLLFVMILGLSACAGKSDRLGLVENEATKLMLKPMLQQELLFKKVKQKS